MYTTTIDKLFLRTTDYTVSPTGNHLITVPCHISPHGEPLYEKRLYQHPNGTWTTGRKAYFNNNIINATIYPGRQRSLVLMVSFCPPKILYDNNFEIVPLSRLPEVITRVSTQLRDEAGIQCNLLNAEINRIDFQATIELPVASTGLISILRNIPFLNRMRLHQTFPTSLLWKNKQREFTVYDKSAEMGGDYMLHPDSVCAIRFEYRLLKWNTVASTLKVSTPSALTQDILNTEFMAVARGLFTIGTDAAALDVNPLGDVIADYFSSAENPTLPRFFQEQGIMSLLRHHGIDELEQAIKNHADSPSTVSRHMKRIREIDATLQAARNNQGPDAATGSAAYAALKRLILDNNVYTGAGACDD